MSKTAALRAGRRLAEAGMYDACTITQATAFDTDPVTGVDTPTEETVYTGKCRLQSAGGYGRNADPTPADPVLMRYRILQLPVIGSGGIRQGAVVVMTTCVNDPDMVGVRMLVRDQDGKSDATARRLGVEEQTG